MIVCEFALTFAPTITCKIDWNLEHFQSPLNGVDTAVL